MKFEERRAWINPVKKVAVKRVLWVGGAGGLDVKPGVRLIDTPDLPDWVRPGSMGKIEALEQLRKERELEWSFLVSFCAAGTRSADPTISLRTDKLLVDATNKSRISVQDYAVA